MKLAFNGRDGLTVTDDAGNRLALNDNGGGGGFVVTLNGVVMGGIGPDYD